MPKFKYSVSLLGLFLYLQPALAQTDFAPTSVRLGTDIVAIGQTVFSPDKTRFEINADLAISKYFLAVDFGMDKVVRRGQEYTYENKGSYFRIGADINFLANDPFNNAFFFGIRYGRAFFNDNLTVHAVHDVYGPYSLYVSNKGLSARWFELVTGLKVRIWKQFFIGYTLRIKFANKIKGAGSLIPYEIPGYGEAEDPTELGVNYQIYYLIPFSKRN